MRGAEVPFVLPPLSFANGAQERGSGGEAALAVPFALPSILPSILPYPEVVLVQFRSSAIAAALALILLCAVTAWPVVHVAAPAAQVTREANVTRTVQSVTFANEVASYGLTLDYNVDPDNPDEITSRWWQWRDAYIPIGMTDPGRTNWYWQAFFNWEFDDESLHRREPTFRVLRPGGDDGMVEFLWDTPKVRASVRFALAAGSDKLLIFGHYEPKQDIRRSRLKFVTYPATFAEPRNRRVTTTDGTFQPGQTVTLDLPRQRWVLYEDVTEGRPADGSSGMLVGTADAFSAVRVPVGDYGIITHLEMAPEARSFALGLYEYPDLPDYEATREYFRASADAEAEQIGRMAAGDLDRPLPAMPLLAARRETIAARQDQFLDRPQELWAPDPTPLDFPWAARLPGGAPINTALLCTRFRAWETMELARRVPMRVSHVYFDQDDALSNPSRWHYSSTTGVGAVPFGLAMQRSVRIVTDPDVEVIVCPELDPVGIPSMTMREIIRRVQEGAGLLLVNSPDRLRAWPQELFAEPDDALAQEALAGLAWENLPGHDAANPPLRAYHYGAGRVSTMPLRRHRYSALVANPGLVDSVEGALDRGLALAARALMAAAGRAPACRLNIAFDEGALAVALDPAPPAGGSLLVRIQDDQDRTLAIREAPLPLADGRLDIPRLPAGRAYFLDVLARDPQGATLGYAFTHAATVDGPAITNITIAPVHQPADVITPMVPLPEGGPMTAAATVEDPGQAADLVFEIRDAFDRLLAREQAAVPAEGGRVEVEFEVNRPVTVSHFLDLLLVAENEEIAVARQVFTFQQPYPLDDYTGLVWSYTGRAPVLKRTNRLAYEWGMDMMDLSHMGGFDDAGATREYDAASRSGLRVVPYVTRIVGSPGADNRRAPVMRDPAYLAAEERKLMINARQAAPFSPAAYTLGDENWLCRGDGECCHAPETVAQFRVWLQDKYGDIATLNDAWDAAFDAFGDIQRPMLREEAAQQTVSIAPWIDFRLFMDTEFAELHELFQHYIRAEDPDAIVGWDGFLGYNWKAGYDFSKLTRNLRLNQVYTLHWLQGELMRSFKRPDALVGKWGNAIADVEGGWHAHAWDGLLSDDNSVWWWSLWGHDYMPFNPDLSMSDFGRWFFEALRETTSGPGKLLLNAHRDDSGVGVLYSHADMFASEVLAVMTEGVINSGFSGHQNQHMGLARGIRDHGVQYRHIYGDDLADELSPERWPIVFLPLAVCLSDEQVAALAAYVEQGGTVVVDGRAGFLTGDGRLRDTRALDDLLGVRGEAGLDAFQRRHVTGPAVVQGTLDGTAAQIPLDFEPFDASAIEPGLQVTTGAALGSLNDEVPIIVVNTVGTGRAITLNLALDAINRTRAQDDLHPLEAILGAVLESAGVTPFSRLETGAGQRPRCIQQVHWRDGDAAYLALFHDILVRGVGEQTAQVTLPEPAFVYDIRAGQRVGAGLVGDWYVTTSRGMPLLYSLLPYEVTGLEAAVPDTAQAGQAIPVAVTVQIAQGEPGRHVVRLDVYPPGAQTSHRQYSQNIECPAGRGAADIPLALDDEPGAWRVVLRDVATGAQVERTVQVN